MDKILAFDYMLSLFEKWHKDVFVEGRDFENHSKLSLLKLLFLTSVPKKDTDETDLLNIFNKFYALPYGPVESDIYEAINSDKLPTYCITERKIIKKTERKLNILPCNDRELIDNEVDKLRSNNETLILLDAFELVEITHQWESWKSAFKFAQFMGIQSYEMESDSIRFDRNKYFGNISSL